MLGFLHGLSQLPVVIAALDIQFGQIADGILGVGPANLIEHVGEDYPELLLVKITLAAATDQQDPIGGHTRYIVEQQGLAEFPGNVPAPFACLRLPILSKAAT